MITLAADTATAYNSVALCDGDTVLAETTVRAGRKHSERLLDTVEWVLSEASIAFADLNLLAISVGPGSFTGLRVGVATWKGLALGAGLPLAGVSTLDGMARLQCGPSGVFCPVLDARMNEVFWAAYRMEAGAPRRHGLEQVTPLEEIVSVADPTWTFFGDGLERYGEALRERVPGATLLPAWTWPPRAVGVALEGMRLHASGAVCDGAHVEPVYLRQSQAEEARQRAVEAPAS